MRYAKMCVSKVSNCLCYNEWSFWLVHSHAFGVQGSVYDECIAQTLGVCVCQKES